MGKFRSFFKENVKQIENEEVQLKRFDEPIIIRAVTAKENSAITDRCYVNKAGAGGKQERKFDVARYNREFCIAAIVSPNLNDVELQESWGVRGADAVFNELFSAGESTAVLEAATRLSGVGTSLKEKIEEAKN